MTAQTLLARLDAVKETGPGTWRARCPSHDSKGRTLAIKEAEDGRVLLRCHAECSALEVVQSVGLTLGDLFPEPLPEMKSKGGKQFPARDVLQCLTHETTVVWVAAQEILQGRKLDAASIDRLTLAASRIHEAKEVAR